MSRISHVQRYFAGFQQLAAVWRIKYPARKKINGTHKSNRMQPKDIDYFLHMQLATISRKTMQKKRHGGVNIIKCENCRFTRFDGLLLCWCWRYCYGLYVRECGFVYRSKCLLLVPFYLSNYGQYFAYNAISNH